MVKYIVILLLSTQCLYAQTGIIAAISRPGTTPTPPTPTPSETGIHVSKSGSDGNACDFDHPCLTIQRGSNVASTGDTIFIHTGTYRETITPATNGQTFMNYSSDVVTISGLELVGNTGWSVHSGQIYKKTISIGPMFTERQTGYNAESLQSNNTELLAQQIFKNDAAQPLACFPKITGYDKLLDRSSFRTKNQATIGVTSTTDAALATYGNITGAIATFNGWFITATRTITSSSGSTINYGTIYDTKFSWFYRVAGHLNLLTQAGEWYYNGSTLYYWQSGGGSPTDLEYKSRNWGIDARGRSDITVKGINFIGCDPVMTTTASTNLTIDNIRAKYTSHHLLETQGGAGDGTGYNTSCMQTGTKILGSGSVLKNSEFRYASGVTVWPGSNVTIENNKFEDQAYGSFYQAPIKLSWTPNTLTGASNVKILHNTFYRSGRGAIEITANNSGVNYQNLEIAYNDFSKYSMVTVDGAAIYGARKSITQNGVIHHNRFRGDGFDEAGTGQQGGIQCNLYWDQGSGGGAICFNVFEYLPSGVSRTGAYTSDFYTQLWWIEVNQYAAYPSILYNNTHIINTGGGQYSYVTYAGKNNTNAGAIPYSIYEKQRNNIYSSNVIVNWGESGDVANSIRIGTNPLFTGVGSGITKFQLQSSSPARGIGTTSISGLPSGAPAPRGDAGALQYGEAPWVPGYIAVTP